MRLIRHATMKKLHRRIRQLEDGHYAIRKALSGSKPWSKKDIDKIARKALRKPKDE